MVPARKLLLVSALGLLLSGCGASIFTEPKTNPVIEDSIGDFARTLATTAERRIVLLPTQGKEAGKFCAEPSPDVAESVAAIFTAGIEADLDQTGVQGGVGKANGKIEFARQLATQVAAVTQRSQGLQAYRDGVFALCQSRLNGFIDNEEYRIALVKLRQEAFALIRTEISHANWNAKPDVVVGTPTIPEKKSDDGGETDTPPDS